MADTERARLDGVMDELCAAVGADAGGTLFVDAGDGTLQTAAVAGSAGSGRARQQSGLMRRLVGHGADDDQRTLVLRLDGVPAGVVVLSRRSGSGFTQQDRAVARLFARRLSEPQVVGQSHVARSGWTRQLEAIQRIAARLTRLASIEDVAATVCTETRTVVDHDEAHVLVASDTNVLRRAAASSTSFADGQVPELPVNGLGGAALARAVQGGVPVLVSDAPDLGPGRAGPHSMLIVPLHYERRVTGVICLVARGSGRFDDDDMRLLQILSDQAAVAIENARLLHGRDALVQELASLLEISEAAGSATDESKVAALLAARLRGATRTDAAIVTRWDEGSTVVRVISRDGVTATSDLIDVADSTARRQVLREGRPVVVHADSEDATIEVQQLRSIRAHTLVLLPLNAGGRTIGMVELIATRAPIELTPVEMQACEAMASLAATGLEKVRVLEQLRNAADMDLVSGVHNHRYLQERLRQEVARSARSHSPLAVLMLDLDQFKPINDTHGHADGDRVLHNIAATIMAHVRSSDVVARYGGDEFVVLMPDTPDSPADHVARRVVSGVLQQRHELSDGSRVSVGVSAGLAVYPTDGRTSTQLLQSADAAMYTAKRSGGRQVERPRSAPSAVELGEPVAIRATA